MKFIERSSRSPSPIATAHTPVSLARAADKIACRITSAAPWTVDEATSTRHHFVSSLGRPCCEQNCLEKRLVPSVTSLANVQLKHDATTRMPPRREIAMNSRGFDVRGISSPRLNKVAIEPSGRTLEALRLVSSSSPPLSSGETGRTVLWAIRHDLPETLHRGMKQSEQAGLTECRSIAHMFAFVSKCLVLIHRYALTCLRASFTIHTL